jgi:hypothetical protein
MLDANKDATITLHEGHLTVVGTMQSTVPSLEQDTLVRIHCSGLRTGNVEEGVVKALYTKHKAAMTDDL